MTVWLALSAVFAWSLHMEQTWHAHQHFSKHVAPHTHGCFAWIRESSCLQEDSRSFQDFWLSLAGCHLGHHHMRVPWDYSCLSFPATLLLEVSQVPENLQDPVEETFWGSPAKGRRESSQDVTWSTERKKFFPRKRRELDMKSHWK